MARTPDLGPSGPSPTGKVEPCLCGAAAGDSEYLYRIDRAEVRACRRCGLGRALVSDFDAASYYASGYFDGRHVDGYADYAGSEASLRAEFARTVTYLRRFKPAGRLLEIGCAFGFFLLEAKNYFDVQGVEISPEAVAQCHARSLGVTEGAFTQSVAESVGEVDVVVMLDVIEHLEKPLDVLALAAGSLRTGGMALITTGDFGSVSAKLFGRRWRLMTPPQHLWFFTIRALETAARKVGLELVAADHPWKQVPLSLIEFQLKRMLGLSRSTKTLLPSSASLPVNLFDAMRVVFRKAPA